jgi:hypothetical protein
MQEFPNEDGGGSLDNGQINYPQGPKKLDRSQKIAVTVLAFFALLVMGMWFVQTKNSLNKPFDVGEEVNDEATCPDGNCADSATNLNLRSKDTDKDGLNDYDELNLYHTSPFIEDSDSDGYSDKKEVESRNDPVCPLGQDCSNEPIPENTKIQESVDGFLAPDDGLNDENPLSTNSISNSEKLLESSDDLLGGKSEPDKVRAMLLQAGMEADILDQISDEELMTSYQEMMNNQ